MRSYTYLFLACLQALVGEHTTETRPVIRTNSEHLATGRTHRTLPEDCRNIIFNGNAVNIKPTANVVGRGDNEIAIFEDFPCLLYFVDIRAMRFNGNERILVQ